MNLTRLLSRPQTFLLGGLIAAAMMSGCQTSMNGQTLPSAYYLRDDIQYFPAGPETLLPNTIKEHEEYRARQGAPDYTPAPAAANN